MFGTPFKEYWRGQVTGVKMFAHQVIYALTHGHWPTTIIDHKDGNPSNTAPGNLREATPKMNSRNAIGKGCYLRRGRWYTKITVDGKTVPLGTYDTEAQAREVYLAAKLKYHPECVRNCNDPI